MVQHPTLIRKRLIPLETLRLEKDVVIHRSQKKYRKCWGRTTQRYMRY